jgi:hypothetical protein
MRSLRAPQGDFSALPLAGVPLSFFAGGSEKPLRLYTTVGARRAVAAVAVHASLFNTLLPGRRLGRQATRSAKLTRARRVPQQAQVA